jgi:DNA-binding NarL/FixJ family response regulator
VPLIRVLVADDFAPVLSAVGALLRGSFDVVRLVSDGHAALEGILKLAPDLAVLDISMPGMNGIEVARELQGRANKTRIVFLTSVEDSVVVNSCMEAGGLGYVLKISMDADLLPAMQDALAGRTFVSRFSCQGDTP